MTLEKLHQQNYSTDVRVALIEQCMGTINDTLTCLRSDMKDMKADIKNSLYDTNQRIDANQKWLMGTAVTVLLGVIGILINATRLIS